MKRIMYIALLMFGVFAISATSYAQKGQPSTAAQIKDVASSTVKSVKEGVGEAVKTVGNVADTVGAAVKAGVKTVDTSGNFRLMYNDVKSGIAGIASALKVGAEHVYYVLCKQQVVKAISDLLLTLLLFSLAYALYRIARNTYSAHLKQCGYDAANAKNSNYNVDIDDSAKGIASVFLSVFAAAAVIGAVATFCCNYQEMITGFVNPEYGAMSTIFDFMKSATGH